jgi:hypothetical protein
MPDEEEKKEVELQDITLTGTATKGFGEEDLEDELSIDEQEDEEDIQQED